MNSYLGKVNHRNVGAYFSRLKRAVIPAVITQHAEEAAFLWLLRNGAIDQPHYSLADLAGLDERVEAHLDGLRIAGEPGWEICKEQLSWQEAGEVFAASVIALENGFEEPVQAVVEAGSASDEQARGLISALGWIPYKKSKTYIDRLLSAESAALRRIGLAAAAVHRQDPGRALRVALRDDDPQLRARALKAAGELGRTDLLDDIVKQTKATDDVCRFWAAWSGALLGVQQVGVLLRYMTESGGPFVERACTMAVRTLRLREALDWQRRLANGPEHVRLAVIGAGVIGDSSLIPWLMEQMTQLETARVAGEAFTMITGADFVDLSLEGEWPEGFEAGPTEDAEDDNVEMDPDEDLPWPDPALIEQWWQEHRGSYRAGARYFLGQPMTEPSLMDALRNGMQRQRAAAALELAIRNPEQPLFEVRAPGFRQQQLLGL